ncbi:MAG: PAS domain-containing sensor histidine kinase [Bacteroidota bacterium]
MRKGGIDFRLLFETTPGLYLILDPDLYIIAVNDAYASATMTQRKKITGRHIFDVFPDNPDDKNADGVSNLRASLDYVRKKKKPHTMAVQKYDIRRPDGTFEVRYWSPKNIPVLDKNKKLLCIIHRVEDVTEFILIKKGEEKRKKVTSGLRHKVQEMEAEIYRNTQALQKTNKQLNKKIIEQKKTAAKLQESQDLFSTSFFKSPVMNTITDALTGKYIEVNENFAEFCGLKKENMIGCTSAEIGLIITPDEREKMLKELNEKGFVHDMLTKVKTFNGNIKWVSTSAHRLILNGRDCFLTASIDVTERIKAEEYIKKINEGLEILLEERTKEVLESEKRLRSTLDNMMEGIQIISYDWKYIYVNTAAAKHGKATVEELIGKTMMEKYPGIENTEVFRHIQNCMEDRTSHFMENEFLFPDDSKEWFELSIQPVPEGVFILSINITARKKAELELEDQNKKLKVMNRELEQFAFVASHDLQEPLRSLISFTELLQKEYYSQIDENGTRYMDFIIQSSKRMQNLVKALLDYSRLGKEPVVSQVDCNELMKEVLSDMSLAIKESKAVITIHQLPVIHAYRVELRLLFQNLLSNAIKFRKEGVPVNIEVSAKKQINEWLFSVADNGIGISEENTYKIFTIFKRLHNRNEYEGAGIGLSHCKKIVELHGGHIWVNSRPGEGSTFYFTIPKMNKQ